MEQIYTLFRSCTVHCTLDSWMSNVKNEHFKNYSKFSRTPENIQ